jgi:SagB-type dehydrogenase family enzyme
MTIELSSPRPRARQRSRRPVELHLTEAVFLPPPPSLRIPFDRVLTRRRSIREFGEPLSVKQLAALLGLAVKSRPAAPRSPHGWQSRPYPSAGGCHEIDLLVLNIAGHPGAAFIYNARHHALGLLGDVKRTDVRRFIAELKPVVPAHRATVCWFVADPPKLAAKYVHAESLLWRDAGSLLATLSLTASALGYASCGVGCHAPDVLRTMLPDPSLVGVGGCLVALPSKRSRRRLS